MVAANKNHPNWGSPLLQPRSTLPTSSPKHLVELDSYKFDYLTGDGYGFTVRIPGRKPQPARTQDVLERARQHSLQTFEEARSKSRKKQVTPAYAIDLTNEQGAFQNVTPSLPRRYHGNDSGEDSAKNILRRGMTGQFDRDVLERRSRHFARSRTEHGMLLRSEDNEKVKTQSAGHRPRNERPLFEPSAPIPSYSHVSTPHVNRKRWRTTWIKSTTSPSSSSVSSVLMPWINVLKPRDCRTMLWSLLSCVTRQVILHKLTKKYIEGNLIESSREWVLSFLLPYVFLKKKWKTSITT